MIFQRTRKSERYRMNVPHCTVVYALEFVVGPYSRLIFTAMTVFQQRASETLVKRCRSGRTCHPWTGKRVRPIRCKWPKNGIVAPVGNLESREDGGGEVCTEYRGELVAIYMDENPTAERKRGKEVLEMNYWTLGTLLSYVFRSQWPTY
jgi:hypothetical protein